MGQIRSFLLLLLPLVLLTWCLQAERERGPPPHTKYISPPQLTHLNSPSQPCPEACLLVDLRSYAWQSILIITHGKKKKGEIQESKRERHSKYYWEKNFLPNPLKSESARQDWGKDSINGLWILFPSPLLFKLGCPMF